MKANYDQKYLNPSKTSEGVRQSVVPSHAAEESSLKAYYHAQSQNRLKVFQSYSLITARCTLVQSAVLRSCVVCLSVCDVEV